jgi:gas vesicle protein
MSFAPTELRLRLSAQQQWTARLSRAKRVLSSFALAAFLFSCGGVIDWLVSHHYLPRICFMLAGLVVSSAVGLLFSKTLSEIQERHQALVRHGQHIAELNHHIRNALQVITFHNVAERSGEAIKQIDAAIARIERVLREWASTSHPQQEPSQSPERVRE